MGLASLDLFSGYGGISLGLRDYVKPIGYCEIDDYARAILASRISEGELPFAPILRDVKSLRGKIGVADIITAGFPCQDISSAGLGAGLGGERSGLFFEIVRLTDEFKPTFVFLENVPAIRTRGLREIVRAFTNLRYDCRWTCVSAAELGAPHKRQRWFLLAHANSKQLRNKSNGKSERKSSPIAKYDGAQESMADSKSIRLEAQSHGRRGVETKLSEPWASGARDESWWSVEPDVGRVVNGLTFRVDRIKAIGNGVVPFQVKTAFEKLIGLPTPRSAVMSSEKKKEQGE